MDIPPAVLPHHLSLRGRSQGVISTIERAIIDRFPNGVCEAGLKIASDNGSAFLSQPVHELAKELEIGLMRTHVSYPEGNGRCERVIRTIKEEEVWLNIYETFEQARSSISDFIDLYNTERIHSALGYISPRRYAARWRSGDPPKKPPENGLSFRGSVHSDYLPAFLWYDNRTRSSLQSFM